MQTGVCTLICVLTFSGYRYLINKQHFSSDVLPKKENAAFFYAFLPLVTPFSAPFASTNIVIKSKINGLKAFLFYLTECKTNKK